MPSWPCACVCAGAMIAEGTLDAFAPKSVYLRGRVTESDLAEYNGWAKVGCVLLTMEDDLIAINARLDKVVRRLFYGEARGFLPVEVVDEDGEGDTGMRHDSLYAAASPSPPPSPSPALMYKTTVSAADARLASMSYASKLSQEQQASKVTGECMSGGTL